MFHDMGHHDHKALDEMSAKFRPWLEERMKSQQYLAWLTESDDGKIVAGAGLWIMDWPPHMIGTQARRGNALNFYTVPEFRRRGLARRLMETLLAWCRENSLEVLILHASKEGRPLYESLGFEATNEMRLLL